MPQPRRHALAEFEAFLAHDDGRAPGELGRPRGDIAMRAPHGARHQPRVERKILVGAHIDDHRTIGPADQTGQFFSGDGVGRGHGGVLWTEQDAMIWPDAS
jgi:hypothetical protein